MKLQKEHPFYKQIVAIQSFLSLFIILLASFFLVRFYEWIIVGNLYNFPKKSWTSNLYGFLYDMLTCIKVTSLLAIPYFLLYLISAKIAKYFFVVASSIILVAQLLLIQYFSQAQVPLGSDLFGYSQAEIEHTVGASGGISYWLFLPIAFICLCRFICN